jgi:hypothetical protein
MLSRKLSPFGAVDGTPRFADSIEYLTWMHAIVCPIDVARPAARNEVCHDRHAAVLARDQMIELRAFDR